MNGTALNPGSTTNQCLPIKEKWLFTTSPIILNGPIQQAHDMADKKERRMSVRKETKAVPDVVFARTRME
ncbi:MAG TPA: hypothetical protein VFQ87_13220 [Bradyrhizobium sp.]|jgi:hypothetical protein|nr:hypothetical protein [Bradyrhizobium sp.]